MATDVQGAAVNDPMTENNWLHWMMKCTFSQRQIKAFKKRQCSTVGFPLNTGVVSVLEWILKNDTEMNTNEFLASATCYLEITAEVHAKHSIYFSLLFISRDWNSQMWEKLSVSKRITYSVRPKSVLLKIPVTFKEHVHIKCHILEWNLEKLVSLI